ncbi:MAG: hypothetical protein PVF17_13650, partial [Ignavibacteria bacterium]
MFNFIRKYPNRYLVKILATFFISFVYIQAQDSPKFLKGTSIIGYINHDTIWVAADSRITILLDDHTAFIDTGCKIVQRGKFIVAVAGMLYAEGKKFNFRADDLVPKGLVEYLGNNPTLVFNTCIQNLNLSAWNYFNLNNEQIREVKFPQDTLFENFATGVLFAHIDESGQPRIDYYMTVPAYLKEKGITSVPINIPPFRLEENRFVYRLGKHNIIDTLINKGFLDIPLPIDTLLTILIKKQANEIRTV